jgi:hypothetical protein
MDDHPLRSICFARSPTRVRIFSCAPTFNEIELFAATNLISYFNARGMREQRLSRARADRFFSISSLEVSPSVSLLLCQSIRFSVNGI